MAKEKSKGLIKAKEAKETKGRLMLNPRQSPISSKQLLYILQKTPEEHIYNRKGKGGKNFDYVTGVYMKKVLNFVFGWMWSFEVIEHGVKEKQIWVLGKLTINTKKGEIIKTQFGRADIKFYKDKTKGMLDFGNDLKAATTDCLKKCASELGIASDIYGKNEFKKIQLEDKRFDGLKDVRDFEKAKDAINIARTVDGLMAYSEKLKDSKRFNTKQKAELRKSISDRVNEISK